MKNHTGLTYQYLLQDKFYKSRIERGLIKEGDLDSVIFASKPAGGAAIFKFDH